MKTISIVLLLVVSSFVSFAQKEIIKINKQKFEVDTSLNFDLKGYWECFYVEEWGSVKVNNEEFLSGVDDNQTKKLNEFLKDKKIYAYFDETKILSNVAPSILPYSSYQINIEKSSNVDSTMGSYYPIKGYYASVTFKSSVIDSDYMLHNVIVVNSDVITIGSDFKIFYFKRKQITKERLEYITDNKIAYWSRGRHFIRQNAKFIKIRYDILPKDSLKLNLVVIPKNSTYDKGSYERNIPINKDHVALLKLPVLDGKILEYSAKNYHDYGKIKVEINVDYKAKIKEITVPKAYFYQSIRGQKNTSYIIKNDLVEVLEEKDDWLKIRYYAKTRTIDGWIMRSDVE
jgi:hypothetical protein